MKPEIKKQIMLHLPYLAFVYLFGKVGQAFRLAQGADLSGKLLHIGQGFSAAFASAAPSFHPTDLLIGLAAAVIIRLVVYSKQKNAKKYANGKKSFMQRMMDVQQGNDVMNQREKYVEETKDMSRSELNKYNQQVLKDARKRMAEKYGETYDESNSTEDSGDQK